MTIHPSIAAIDRNNLMAPLPTVGLSLGISRSFSSNPLTTNLALVFPSLFVTTHLVDNGFCPQSVTYCYVSNSANLFSSFSLAIMISLLTDPRLSVMDVIFISDSGTFSHSI